MQVPDLTLKEHARIKGAFDRLFKKDGKLTKDGKTVLYFLAKRLYAKGNLGLTPNNSGEISGTNAAYLLGLRHAYDIIASYLFTDEETLYHLAESYPDQEADEVLQNLIATKGF